MAAIDWRLATVARIVDETPRVKTLVLAVPGWPGHRAGQHLDIRLTAEDGYQAQRSYSIANAWRPGGSVELTVEYVEGGEVSPFLHETLIVGDRFEARGPIGGYFTWNGEPDPLLLVAGGSGIVPLMAMLRQRALTRSATPTTLLYSSRTREDVIYFDELEQLAATDTGARVFHTLTRSRPPDWDGYARRIDATMLAESVSTLGGSSGAIRAFVCGPTPLVESVAEGLVALGLRSNQVRTERFGPSGA